MKLPGDGTQLGNTKSFNVNNKSIGGLPFSVGALKDTDRLPMDHEIIIDRVPVFSGMFTQPILVSYFNSSSTVSTWNTLDSNLRKFCLSVERGRTTPGSYWYNVLTKFGVGDKPYRSFYFTITGTATEAWVFAYIHSNGVHKLPEIEDVPYLTPYPASAAPGLPKFTDARTVWMKECFTMKYTAYEEPLVWACHMPVHPDCSYNNKHPTALDFCSGRYAFSTGPFCDNLLQSMSEANQQRLMRAYCEQNPSSNECENK